MPQEIARYRIHVISGGPVSRVLLADDHDRVIASTTFTQTSTGIALTAHTDEPDLAHWRNHGDMLELDDMDESGLSGWRPFRQSTPRAVLVDAAFNWLMTHVLPDFDLPDLQFEEDTFVLLADGKRAGGPRSAARSGAPAAPRPKGKKMRIEAIWF